MNVTRLPIQSPSNFIFCLGVQFENAMIDAVIIFTNEP